MVLLVVLVTLDLRPSELVQSGNNEVGASVIGRSHPSIICLMSSVGRGFVDRQTTPIADP